MSKTIKAFILAVSFMSIQSVMGSELKLLSVKDFQQKINFENSAQQDLSQFEINNDELIKLFKSGPPQKITVR